MASDTSIFESFEESSGGQMSRKERLGVFIDLWILSPLRIMWSDRRTRYGTLIILGYLLIGTVGVWLTDTPGRFEHQPFLAPSGDLKLLFGTDAFGQNLLEMTIHATPPMLKMMFAGGVLSTVLGVLVGGIAGYKRGRTETVLMTISDIVMTLPGLPLLIVLGAALQPRDPLVVGLLISATYWAGFGRTIHSQVLALRSESYVEASRILDLSTLSIVRSDILPNIMPYVMMNFMRNSIRVIHASVGLYFLGVLPFSNQNWGVMLSQAFNSGIVETGTQIHWLLIPIIAINLLGFGVIMFSQGMDRLFNPRVRTRHSSKSDEGSRL